MTLNQETRAWEKARRVFPELQPDQAPSVRRLFPGIRRRGVKPVREQAPVLPARSGAIQATTISFLNMASHGDLLPRLLRARRETFIVEKGWDLPEADGMEFDQYDTPACRWIAVHEDGEILAGIRLCPTTARCGIYSYMTRDAQLGLIDTIPTDILFVDAPVNHYTWEATRLFVTRQVPAERRSLVQIMLLNHMARAVDAMGGTQVIGIVPAVFYRWMKRLGMTAAPVGPVRKIGDDVTQAAMMPVRTALR